MISGLIILQEVKEIMDNFTIEMRKKYNKLANESKRQAKKEQCLWCGEKITRFCNSHSIPQCVLDNIDSDGKLDYFNVMTNIPMINDDKGIKEAGTFKLLCPKCDGTIFQDYENESALENIPSERMLEEIALKNMLMMLNKRYFEIELYNNMKKEFAMPYPYDLKQEVNSLDERDFWLDYCRIRDMMESKNGTFNLFYWEKLNYKIPIAFQGMVTLYGDLEGNLVTDIYNTSEDIIVKHMHVCMFPLESCSVVFAFYHSEDTEYDQFAQQFNSLSKDEKLSLISFIVYEYSEDMLLAKKFPHRTWITNKMRDIFSDTTEIMIPHEDFAEHEKDRVQKRLKFRDKDFPCILFEKYAIK